MASDILQRPDGSLDAWIYPPDHGLVLVAPHTGHSSGHNSGYSHYRTSSPMISQKKLDRPKSVPTTLGSRQNSSAWTSQRVGLHSNNRPKTATGSIKADCGRVHQVEHEPTRKHNLDSHLPVKRIKPPPWQKALDTVPIPCMISPAYTLSRSKTKVAMTINTDSFFDGDSGDHEDPEQEVERDPLVQQLQQQIDDLTLYLEEERLNHRDTKRKAAEAIEERTEDLQRQHEHHMRLMEEQYEEQIERMKEHHTRDMDNLTDSSEQALTKMRGEIDFLQGAFESYKSQLHLEMDERWRKREAELIEKQDKLLDEKLNKLRAKVQHERSAEKTDQSQLHQRDLLTLKQDHKKEINQLLRRFSNAAKDLEDYKKTQDDLEERTRELEDLKSDYDSVCQQTAELTRQLTDMKVELVTYEQTFQDRVQSIDDKYKGQLHELMTQNTELRRLYVKKCGQLFDEKAEMEQSRIDSIKTAKDTMKLVIETRNEALVNLAATDPEYDKRNRSDKYRPSSAPHTRSETETALLSASETDKVVQHRQSLRIRPETCKPRILQQIQQEREDRGETDSTTNTDNKNFEEILLGVINNDRR